MPRATPLPPQLLRRPFTVAEASALGVPPDVLDGRRFRRPHRGVRVPVELPDTLPVRCAALQLLLPATSCFGGTTALQLQRLPVPATAPVPPTATASAAGPALLAAPCVVDARRAREVGGVRSSQNRFAVHHRQVEVQEVPGVRLRVLRPEHAWADAAGELPLVEAVALGDGVRRRWADDEVLASVVAARAGDRHVARLRAALALVRPGVDSWPESVLRVLLVQAGLPEPVVNADVSADGGWLARPDLSWPAVRVAVEYDGDHHRTSRTQWRHDKARGRLLRQHGWVVLELTADDLETPQRTVAMIASTLRERGLTW